MGWIGRCTLRTEMEVEPRSSSPFGGQAQPTGCTHIQQFCWSAIKRSQHLHTNIVSSWQCHACHKKPKQNGVLNMPLMVLPAQFVLRQKSAPPLVVMLTSTKCSNICARKNTWPTQKVACFIAKTIEEKVIALVRMLRLPSELDQPVLVDQYD